MLSNLALVRPLFLSMKKLLQLSILATFLNISYGQAQDQFTLLADKVVDLFSGEIPLNNNPYPIQWVVAPALAYAPETSWQFGIGGNILFKPKRAEDSARTSFVSFAARYTVNNQLLTSADYTLFSAKEKFIQRGTAYYVQFPRFYYGVGNNTPQINEELFSSTLAGAEHIVYRRVWSKLYVGTGLRYVRTFDIETQEGGLLQTTPPRGVDPNQAVGWSVGLLYDSRNNPLGASTGTLFEFRQRFHREFLGSDFNYEVGVLDLRHYRQPFKARRDILAVQLYGYFSGGETPFTELAALGGGMIMRGYYQGRYLDNLLLAAQAEYRVHVWKKIGAVGFAALGDVAEKFSNFRLSRLKPSAGVGLRYALIPEENLNIRVDFAVGQATNNFYIGISEAF